MKIKTMVVAALGLALTATPVSAGTHSSEHHAIRYASVKSCLDKGGAPKPCGHWRLAMHDGSVQLLKDAQVVALTAKGKSSVYQAAPISVSGDGRKVAYFARDGRVAIRTLHGGVTVLARNALPPVAQYNIVLVLSDDGGRLAAMQVGGEQRPARIFDTATGSRVGTIPSTDVFGDFSGDGDEVLTTNEGDESTLDVAVYSTDGRLLTRSTPPQLVAGAQPFALHADGRTLASLVQGGKPEVVLYDTGVDRITSRVRVKLPAGDLHMLDWTGPSQVTAHLRHHPGKGPERMTVAQIDVTTGKVKVRDRYAIMADSFIYAACGG